MQSIYPDKRKKGYVLIEFTGIKRTGTKTRIWPKALIAPRKPMYFKNYQDASSFRDRVKET